MKRLFLFSAVCLMVFTQPAIAGEYKFCLLTNRIANAGELRGYNDQQIENGLCMASKEILSGIVNDDSFKKDICMQAAQHMMLEFNRRFPGRDAKSVSGKC